MAIRSADDMSATSNPPILSFAAFFQAFSHLSRISKIMPPQFPSIQSFFHSSSFPRSKKPSLSLVKTTSTSSPSTVIGDGFTAEEIAAVLNPDPNSEWTPTYHYEDYDIVDLVPGPRYVTFMGRIANIYDQATPSKRPRAARGCIKLTLKDDTGVLTIRLWYANTKYDIHLGQLLSVWTPHISYGENGSLAPSTAPLFTTIFPERDRNCHVMIHNHSDTGELCKTPEGYKEGQPLSRLMTLKSFIEGGYDVTDSRILVCIKSIGARKKITNKNNTTTELAHLGVFDNTASATLTLFSHASHSPTHWTPSHTTLLLTNPGWKFDRPNTARLSLTPSTTLDIDPLLPDALWLRRFAARLTQRTHPNPPFPSAAFALLPHPSAPVRIRYTLADIDAVARANPAETFTGYLSLLVCSVQLVLLARRNMLLGTAHCGMPLFANATAATCRQCGAEVPLALNARIVGALVDETGELEAGKVVFSEEAWGQLLGRSAEDLVQCEMETLKYIEQRMAWVRLTFCFGWVGDAEENAGREGEGRLCVWSVKA